MTSVGSKLKKAREKKHLSLEQISQKTKIHPKILEAIEEDRAHHLLNKVYLKGFLKNYAHFVGVGEEELIQESPQEMTKEVSSFLPGGMDNSSWEEETGVSPWVGRSLLLILVIGAFFLMVIGISKFRGDQKIPLASPPPLNQAANRNPPPAPQGSFIFYPFQIPKNEPLKLKLHANENAWITVTSDNHLMYQGLLAKGKEEIWTAKQSFQISLSDGGAVSIGLNRKVLGIPVTEGRPLEKLVMTREGWKLGARE